MSGMIFGHSDNAWIQQDVIGKLSRNGSFVQIDFEMSGIRHSILLLASDIKKISEIEKHGEGFDALVILSEPATEATLQKEEAIRRKDLQRKIRDELP